MYIVGGVATKLETVGFALRGRRGERNMFALATYRVRECTRCKGRPGKRMCVACGDEGITLHEFREELVVL